MPVVAKKSVTVVVKQPVVTAKQDPKLPVDNGQSLYGMEELTVDVGALAAVQAEIAAIQAKIKPLSNLLSAQKKLSGDIEERIAKAIAGTKPPEEPAEMIVGAFKVEVSKISMVRVISDMKKAGKLLGDTFWEVAKVNLTDLDKYLTLKQREEVIETTYPGTRSVTVQPIASADGML